MAEQTIIEFLEARIAEDEAQATSGWARLGDKRWETNNYGQYFASAASFLAECAAKRAIIKLAEGIHVTIEGEWGGGRDIAEEGWQDNQATDIVRTFAAVYKDHPDYRQEWAIG